MDRPHFPGRPSGYAEPIDLPDHDRDRPHVFDHGREYAEPVELPLTPKEAAAHLHVSIDTLAELRKGRFRGVPRFPEPDVVEGCGKPRWRRDTVERYRLKLVFGDE